MYRTEVFDKYYFPAQWESAEMEAITNFLKLEDPSSSSKASGSRPGKELTGSGRGVGRRSRDSSIRSSGVAKGGGGRLKVSRRATTAGVGNWSVSSGSSEYSARSSITSSFTLGLGDSAGKLTKLLVSRVGKDGDVDCKPY